MAFYLRLIGNFKVSFVLTDWVSTDAGDLYSIDFLHNLDVSSPVVKVYESGSPDKEVQPHSVKVVDSNTIRVSVSRTSADARFAGYVVVDR